MLRRSCGVATALLLALATAACESDSTPVAPGARTASPTVPAHQRAAVHFAGEPRVGALFFRGAYPTLHTCTASVVRARSRDVIVTAAHCVTGTGRGYRFAPGYRDGETPYGVWRVTGAYGDPAWLDRRDPRHDWAVLTVAPHRVDGRSRRLQDVTGGSRVGSTAGPDATVTVVGYALGANDEPLRCTTSVYAHRDYPAFDCDGFPAGTSGSPWLATATGSTVLSGVIGGLHQGGCTPATSYSPLLGPALRRALGRAARGAPADRFPTRGSDHCG